MTPDRTAEDRISAWLRDEAPDQLPDVVLAATFARSRATPQRRTLRGWREILVQPRTRAIAGGAAAIAILIAGAVGLRLLGPSDGVGHPTVSPSPSPTSGSVTPSGQMAFSRTVGGNTDLYLMNLDGTGLVQLTTDPAEDLGTSWSPDGTTLLITRRVSVDPELSELFALDVDTLVERQLTDLGGAVFDPAFSPAGDRIALGLAPTDAGYYVMNPDGSDLRMLVPITTDQDQLKGWSADGKYLFVANGGIDVSRIDVTTGEVTKVISDGAAHRDAVFSPDGTRVAFVGTEPGTIHVANADGSEPVDLGIGLEAGYLSWSPDSAFLTYRDRSGDIYIIRADGTAPNILTTGFAPVWRPGS